MNVTSKPSSKTTSTTRSKSSSPVKKTVQATPVKTQKDSVSLSKGSQAKPNAATPNFGSWALAQPAAPKTEAKPVPNDPAPRVAPKTSKEGGLAKQFDDASWATAQVRHTAEAAQQAGNLAKVQSVSTAGSKALTGLNPVSSVTGSAAFGKMAYDSYQKGNYGDAALQGANSLGLAATTAGAIPGGAAVAKVAGRAAPALGGALQAYQGIKSGDTFDTVSGGAKIAGAAMIATGFGAPVGSALIIGSYMADLGRWGYQKWSGQ
jgi:hypothetical protein